MIIDYRLFYFIGFFEKLNTILLWLLIIGSFLYIFTCLHIVEDLGYDKDKQATLFKKMIKIYIIIATIVLVTLALIPSRETMYKMLIFKNLTYENIDKTQKSIKETVDYIFKKIGDLNENR